MRNKLGSTKNVAENSVMISMFGAKPIFINQLLSPEQYHNCNAKLSF